MENGVLELRIAIRDRLTPSKSGKTLIVVDSGDIPTSIRIEDRKLYVRVLAYVRNRPPGISAAELLAQPGMAEALAEPEAVVTEQEERMSGLQSLYRQFWTSLKERAKERTTLFNDRPVVPGTYSYWGISVNGIGFNYIITRRGSRVLPRHDSRVEVYIGTSSKQENKRIYRSFLSRKDRIESAFGGQLVWQELPHRDDSRVFYPFSLGTLYDQEKWPKIQDAMIDGMIRLHRAFWPEIDGLP